MSVGFIVTGVTLAIVFGVLVWARATAYGNGWKIEASIQSPYAGDPYVAYYVYKALGPFPLINWSWTYSYCSRERKACEEWVRKAIELERKA